MCRQSVVYKPSGFQLADHLRVSHGIKVKNISAKEGGMDLRLFFEEMPVETGVGH